MNRLLPLLSVIWRWLIIGSVLVVALPAAIGAAETLTSVHAVGVVVTLVFLFGGLFVCICVHEFGHAAGAVLAGWRVHLIVAGPIGYRPGVRRFMRMPIRHNIGGWVVATPGPGRDRNRGRSIFILGGPVANLLLAGGGLAIAMFSERQAWVPLVGCIAVQNLAIGVANLLPFSEREGHPSDGARLIRFWAGNRGSRVENALSEINGQILDGVDPREWDPRIIADAERSEANASTARRRDMLLLRHFFSVGNLPKCRDITARLIQSQKVPDPLFLITHAFVIAMVDGSAGESLRILSSIPKPATENSFAYLRALATALYVAGDIEAARAAATQAQTMLKASAVGDEDDRALLSAIVEARPLPLFGRPIA